MKINKKRHCFVMEIDKKNNIFCPCLYRVETHGDSILIIIIHVIVTAIETALILESGEIHARVPAITLTVL